MDSSRRMGGLLRLSLALAALAAFIGCNDPTAPEHAAEVFERNPDAVEELATMIRQDVRDNRLLVIRPDHLATDSVSLWAAPLLEAHAMQADLTLERLATYLSKLDELGARGISTTTIRESRVIEIDVAASGISVSGCLLSLVKGRGSWPGAPGNPVRVVRLPGGWFAEQTCT